MPESPERQPSIAADRIPRRQRDYRALDLHRLMEYDSIDQLTGRHRIARSLAPPKADDVALDVGCAYGYWVNLFLRGRATQVIGVDLDREDVGRAARFAQPDRGADSCAFGVASAESLPFSDNSFTLVYLMDVLEHVNDPAQTALEVCRVLAPGGRLVVSVPGYWAFNWLDPHYPEHRHYTRSQLASLFSGLEVLRGYQTGFLWAAFWGTYIRFLCTRATRLVPTRRLRATTLRAVNRAVSQVADFDCRFNYGFGSALCLVFRKPVGKGPAEGQRTVSLHQGG